MTKFLQDLLFKGTVTLSTFVGSGTRMVVAGADGMLSTQTIPTGNITGTGTTNYAARWTSSTTLGNSAIYDNGSIIAVGTASPNSQSRLTLMGSPTYSKSIVLDSTWDYQTSFAMKNGIYSTEFNLGGASKSTNEGGPGSLQVSTYNATTGQYRYPITFFANANVSFGGTGSSVPLDNGSTLQVNGSVYASTLVGTGTRMVVASATGVLSTQAIPSGSGAEADTLDSVTDRGAITTNAISVGGITSTGITLTSNGNLITTNQFYGLASNYTDGIFVGFDSGAVYLGYKLGSTPIHLGTSGTGNVLIRTSGNTIIENGKLFIGTSTDAGYNLDAVGKARFSDHVVINTDAALFSGSSYNGYKMLGIGGATGGGVSFVSNNGIAAEIFGDNGLTGLYLASYGAVPVITFYINTTEAGRFTTDNEFQVHNLAGTGTRMVVADATGKLSVQTIPTLSLTDTLDSVTDRGATTSNAITVGALTVSNASYTGTAYIEQTANYTTRITGGPQEYITFGPDNAIRINTNLLVFSVGSVLLPAAVNWYAGSVFSPVAFSPAVGGAKAIVFGGNYTNIGAGGTYAGSNVVAGCDINTSIGTITLNQFSVENTINTTAGLTTHRGFYYNPTVSGSVGLTNIAFESTSGIVKISDLSGTGTRMVVADATGKLGVQEVPTVSLTDTLDSVTDRGATTTNSISVGGLTVATPSGGAGILFNSTAGGGSQWSIQSFSSVNTISNSIGFYNPISETTPLVITPTKLQVKNSLQIIWGFDDAEYADVGIPNAGIAWEAANTLKITNGSTGYGGLKLNDLKVVTLVGTGTRMVVADANGLLSTQAIPSGGAGGSGTVTSVSVVSANGFAGTVATDTTTPAITLSTTVTGLLKGNGTAISAASAGTDYEVPLSFSNGLTRTSNAIKFGGTISENTTLNGTDNTLNLVATNMKKVTLRAGTAGSMVTGRFETSVFNDTALTEMDVSNAAGTKSANVTVYENGGTPYISLFAKGSTIASYFSFLQLASGNLEYSSGVGSATLRFSVDVGGNVYIYTTPSLNNTATNILVRDSNGQIQYRTVASLGIGNGTVTSVSVASANGFAGTVATDTTTPAITLTTTVTGILKGNGTAISAAVAGTDYLTSSDLSGYLTSATAASTYQPLDGDLTAIAALAGTSGFLKKTAANTWTLDTNTYLTSYTETDPVWTSEKVNYFTKTEGDARYLQSYTEIYQGTVTSVAALTLGTSGTDLSSTVATGTTTPVITLNVPTASASNRGALSSTDWSTFNGKQAGSTNLTSLSGLSYAATSFVKMTAAGTFALDTNTYYLASNPSGYTTNTGTVTTVSVVSANGLAGTVATAGTTPAITLSTTITGLLKGNGTAISAAVAGTDYLTSNQTITLSGAVSGSGTTAITTTLANSVVGIANLSATGTPSASTYLRGDNTWATISAGGGYSVTTQTTTHSVTATSGTTIVKGDTTGGTFTITLPTAVGNTATIIIKKTAGSAALVIDGAGTETIDGGLTATINKVYESVTLISDNANWQIV